MLESIDLGRSIALLITPFVLFMIAFFLESRNTESWVIRKYVHSVGLFVAGLYGAFMNDLTEILILVTILIILVLLLSVPPIRFIQRLTGMATREGESQNMLIINGFSTSFGVIVLIILFFDIKWIFLASVYCVALGDGLGEIIGKPYGKRKYKIFLEKSIEGSIAVFLGSVVGGVFSLLFFNKLSIEFFLVVLLASFIVTLIEAASIAFLDNLIMPISYASILWYFAVF